MPRIWTTEAAFNLPDKNARPAIVRRLLVFCVSAFILILFGGFFAFPLNAQIYVAQTAQGKGDGSSAANATSLAWLNEASNWNPGVGSVRPGTIVNLIGTLTNELNILGSGTADKPITIHFEPNAKFAAPFWPVQWRAGGAITIIAKNYIVLDGGSNGMIEATENGTRLAYQTNSCGIAAASASDLTVRNLTIEGMYVRASDADEAPQRLTVVGIQDRCTVPPYGITNFIVTNCVIRDAVAGITADYGTCRNYYFTGNKISRCNWGSNCADRGSGSTMANLIISKNNIGDFTNWNDPGADDFHHNGFYGWAESGGVMDGALVFGNKIGPNYGGPYSTSGVFFSGQVKHVWIYNNVFVCNTNDGPADGLITMGKANETNNLIANNTFIGGGASSAVNVTCARVYNNLAINCTLVLDNYAIAGELIADNNFGFNLNSGEGYSYAEAGTSGFRTFAEWQALGLDLHGSANVDPLLSSNGMLQARSPMKAAGVNLSSYFRTDYAGNPRPATGKWTVGAYQVSSPGISNE